MQMVIIIIFSVIQTENSAVMKSNVSIDDTKGRMWIGTSGSGLNLCTPQDDYHSLKYEHYGTSEGLVNDVIQSVLGDRKGTFG